MMRAGTEQTRQQMVEMGKSHPAEPFVFFIPVLVVQVAYVALSIRPLAWPELAFHGALLVLGGLAWTLVEYGLHRFSFHPADWLARMKIPLLGTFIRRTSMVHLAHHAEPTHPRLIVAPLILSAPLYGMIFTSIWGLTRGLSGLGGASLSAAASLGSGLLAGYLLYEYVHYSTHRFRPRTPISRYWKKHHMLHHFANQETCFGVTTTLWDRVFGTGPSRK